ncbi:MAG: adenine phosphoribosyltransferase [candidate division Zixibacteria bacterium]|nr:adenine phosphoribosyltransferase [candidate division Zixibacteria bacterium]
MEKNLKLLIRNVKDYPKKGVVFRDITTLLKNGKAFKKAVDLLYKRYKNRKIDLIAAIESRGFILGGALANKMGIGFVPVRKFGKLPADTVEQSYNLEYGTDALELHRDAVKRGQKVLIVDDLLATGGTLQATCKLIEKLGGKVAGILVLIELSFLKGEEKLKNYDLYSLIKYDRE